MPARQVLRGPYKKWIQTEGCVPRSTRFSRKPKDPGQCHSNPDQDNGNEMASMMSPRQCDSASDPDDGTETVPMRHSDSPAVMESESNSDSDDGMEMDPTVNPHHGSTSADPDDVTEMDPTVNPHHGSTSADPDDVTEMDPTVNPHHGSTSADPDDVTEMNEDMMYSGSTVTLGQGLLAIMLFALRHHLTGAALSDLLCLMNFLIPNLVPASKYLFKKFFGDPSMSSVSHFYCQDCQNYMGKNPDDALCSHCGMSFNTTTSLKRGNFFLSLSLKDLLKDTLENHGIDLISKSVRHAHDNIKDLMDGKMYQKLLKQGKLAADDLTLLWNCDGVPIFNSSNYSIWPLQFTINELPYIQRKENVIVAGLWFGPEKPRMDTFLKPFIDECCDLAQNPFEWKDSQGTTHSSKVFSLVCSSDAIARPLLRNCKQFNGEYGCDWCLHPGVVIPKGRGFVRSYAHDEEQQVKRTHSQFKDNAIEAIQSATPQNGVKGLSMLFMLPLFNIVFGFVPDYMHSVLLGVCRQLMSLWLDTCNCLSPWYIGRKIAQLDSHLLCLKPPKEIVRAPRSLLTRKFWKASEWRAFILFYSISVLPGVLPPAFLQHYFLLMFSIHILLQESISPHDLQLAHNALSLFVVQMGELYGQAHVSFNCHQLIHLTDSVLNWGPLWATSSFNFENNNGYLKTLFNGTQYVPQQICQLFVLWRDIPKRLCVVGFDPHSDFGMFLGKLTDKRLVKECIGSFATLGKSSSLALTGSIKLAVEELLNRTVPVKRVESYDRFVNGNMVYHTTNYRRSEKRNNTVIKLKNESCGEILLFFLLKLNCVCTSNCLCQTIPVVMVQLYDKKADTLFNFRSLGITSKKVCVKVERTRRLKAFFLEDIRCKCMYVNGWLVPLPNTYERD